MSEQDSRTQHVHLSLERGYEIIASFPETPALPSLRLDEPPPLGAGQGPNAAAVLAAAVGDCLSASLLFCLRKARVDVTRLETDVAVHLGRTETGRLRITGIDVELSPAVTGDASRFQRCEELFEDFCPVTQSVRLGIAVNVTVRRPGGDAG